MFRKRTLLLISTVVLIAQGAKAEVPCPSFMPGCGFSISGKNGPFLKQIDPQKLSAESAALSAAAGESKGLGEHSINKGEFSGASLSMPYTEGHLGELLDRLRAHWPYQDPGPIKIHMIGSTSYGPKSQPDNSIVVPLGFLQRSKSDDEVAWVLAHEFSHIALRHFARSAELARRKHTTDMLVNGLIGAFALSQERVQNTGQGIHLYAINDPRVRARSDGTWAQGQQVRLLLNLNDQALSRLQEDQADAVGVDLAVAAGYAADEGAAHALDVVAEDDAKEAAKLRTFQSQLQAVVVQSVQGKDVQSATAGNLSGAGSDFFSNLKKNLAHLAFDKLIAYMSESHRPAPQRRKGIVSYMSAAYPTAAADTKAIWLNDVRGTPEFQQASAAVNAHDLALTDLEAGAPQKALEDLQPALKTRFSNTPFIDDEAARIYDSLGDFSTADRLYDQAERPPEPAGSAPSTTRSAGRSTNQKRGRKSSATAAATTPPVVSDTFIRQSLNGYKDHVDLLATHGQYPKAKAKIAEAKALFGDDEAFLPSLIYIDLKTGANDDMAAAVSECLGTENEVLRQQCRYAVLDDSQKDALKNMPPAQRAKLDKALARTDSNVDQAAWWKGMTSFGDPSGQGAPKN